MNLNENFLNDFYLLNENNTYLNTKSNKQIINSNEEIKFNNEITINEDGIYFITFNLQSTEQNLSIRLTKNQEIIEIFNTNISQTIIKCNKGDSINLVNNLLKEITILNSNLSLFKIN